MRTVDGSDADRRHPCPVDGCTRRIPSDHLACPDHWDTLSGATRDAVYAAWRSLDADRIATAMTAAVEEMNTL